MCRITQMQGLLREMNRANKIRRLGIILLIIGWWYVYVYSAKVSTTYLITHASDNWSIPVGRETCHRFQGEGAGRPDECDHVVPEVHVRR